MGWRIFHSCLMTKGLDVSSSMSDKKLIVNDISNLLYRGQNLKQSQCRNETTPLYTSWLALKQVFRHKLHLQYLKCHLWIFHVKSLFHVLSANFWVGLTQIAYILFCCISWHFFSSKPMILLNSLIYGSVRSDVLVGV